MPQKDSTCSSQKWKEEKLSVQTCMIRRNGICMLRSSLWWQWCILVSGIIMTACSAEYFLYLLTGGLLWEDCFDSGANEASRDMHAFRPTSTRSMLNYSANSFLTPSLSLSLSIHTRIHDKADLGMGYGEMTWCHSRIVSWKSFTD